MINILLVDDEKKICEFVKAYLEKEGYHVDAVYDGNTAIKYFDNKKYNLVILDRMLPDINGEIVCNYMREKSNTPIIMLTARVEDEDRIEGFTLGCDDYVCKPFNVKELILRIKAVLKRSGADEDKVLTFGNELQINTSSHEVKVRDEDVVLTNTEYKILLTMASNPKKVFTREELLEIATEDPYVKMDRVIDSHIKNLRQKIKLSPSSTKIIQTIYGVGYKFGL
ncbi:MAG: response regulator transcription factor [Peptostreptococcaceae bacterium]